MILHFCLQLFHFKKKIFADIRVMQLSFLQLYGMLVYSYDRHFAIFSKSFLGSMHLYSHMKKVKWTKHNTGSVYNNRSPESQRLLELNSTTILSHDRWGLRRYLILKYDLVWVLCKGRELYPCWNTSLVSSSSRVTRTISSHACLLLQKKRRIYLMKNKQMTKRL